MDNITVRVLNTANGQVQVVPAKLMNNPHFREFHVEVEDDVQSFTPGLYAPKTAVEYERMHTRLTEPAPDFTQGATHTEKEND